ncbi:MAG TPA: hypothetical protein PKJ28_07215 [Bacteroidales bacterium]|nr:hypothetical protein [Bacteroidales bacterium]HPS74312.1 hypothetical protein [Bacteroidales bacterium]
MKRKLTGLGILVMLILRNPPIPEFAVFNNISIVAVQSFSRKRLALMFHLN